MKYKILMLVILILSPFPILFSQSSLEKVEEMEKKLLTSSGKEKVDILTQLNKYWRNNKDFQKSLKYGNMAIELAGQIYYPEGEANALLAISYTYRKFKNLEKAFESIDTAKKIFQRITNKKGIVRAIYVKAGIYRLENRYDEALKYYFKSLKLCEEIKENYKEHQHIHLYLGMIYNRINDQKKALKYYQKGLQLAKQTKNKKDIAHFYNQLGVVHHYLDENDLALDYYQRSLQLQEELGNYTIIPILKLNIGIIYLDFKNYKKALSHLHEALKLLREYKDSLHILKTIWWLGKYYFETKQYEKSFLYFQEALSISGSFNDKLIQYLLYKDFSDLYYAMGEFKEAIDYHKKYSNLKDEVTNEKKNKQIAQLQEKYEAEKREKDIEILTKTNKIERMTRYILIAGLLIALVILFIIIKKYLYFFTFWKKQKYIGQYRLMEHIGSGGIGTIYKAHDIKDKTRTLAIKVLREEYSSDENYKKRFKNEASIIDQLSHPNIVKVVERGEDRGKLYIVMELLDGKSLAEIISERRLDISVALTIMIQVTEAIIKIHQKKIIHRDLKPENIMIIQKEDNPYFVKLLDFGLAKTQTLTSMTQTGIVMGTVFYLAPEQIRFGKISNATDIYALGVTFYQLLSGEKPFFADTAIEITRQILEQEAIDPKKFRPEIPETLDRLIIKMLSKEPKQRPKADFILNTLNNLFNSYKKIIKK